MKLPVFIMGALLLTLMFPPVMAADVTETVVLPVTEDSQISSQNPDTNYGSEVYMDTRTFDNGVVQRQNDTLLRVSISPLEDFPSTSITQATLSLILQDCFKNSDPEDADGFKVFWLRGITQPPAGTPQWFESNVTWNSMNQGGLSLDLVHLETEANQETCPTDGTKFETNVVVPMRHWALNGTPGNRNQNHGFYLQNAKLFPLTIVSEIRYQLGTRESGIGGYITLTRTYAGIFGTNIIDIFLLVGFLSVTITGVILAWSYKGWRGGR